MRDSTFKLNCAVIPCESLYARSSAFLSLARSKPIKTSSVISLIKRIYRKHEHKIEYVKSAKGEMLKTHGCNKRIMNDLKKQIQHVLNLYQSNEN